MTTESSYSSALLPKYSHPKGTDIHLIDLANRTATLVYSEQNGISLRTTARTSELQEMLRKSELPLPIGEMFSPAALQSRPHLQHNRHIISRIFVEMAFFGTVVGYETIIIREEDRLKSLEDTSATKLLLESSDLGTRVGTIHMYVGALQRTQDKRRMASTQFQTLDKERKAQILANQMVTSQEYLQTLLLKKVMSPHIRSQAEEICAALYWCTEATKVAIATKALQPTYIHQMISTYIATVEAAQNESIRILGEWMALDILTIKARSRKKSNDALREFARNILSDWHKKYNTTGEIVLPDLTEIQKDALKALIEA